AETQALEEAECAQRELEDKVKFPAEEAECEHKEVEKKKPKMNNFNKATPIFNIIVPCPFQYALQKLSTFDYIDLWYFSPPGCLEASKFNRSNTDDAFYVFKIGNVLTLCSIASVKVSVMGLDMRVEGE
ncbi:hypothetical protein PAXRUDRAFT_140147, partial [Paxillus rubicundulus Ve08.2h10]